MSNCCGDCNECKPPTSNQLAHLSFLAGKDANGCNKYESAQSVVISAIQNAECAPTPVSGGDSIQLIGKDGFCHTVNIPASVFQNAADICTVVDGCVVDLRTRLTNAENNITNLTTVQGLHNTRIVALETLENTFCARVLACVNAYIVQIAEHEVDITALQTLTTTHTSQITTIDGRVGVVEGWIANACTNVQSCMAAIIAGVNTRLNIVEADITQLETDVANHILAYNTFVSGICATVAACSQISPAINWVANACTNVLACVQSELDNLQAQITAAVAAHNALQTAHNTLQTAHNTLNTQVQNFFADPCPTILPCLPTLERETGRVTYPNATPTITSTTPVGTELLPYTSIVITNPYNTAVEVDVLFRISFRTDATPIGTNSGFFLETSTHIGVNGATPSIVGERMQTGSPSLAFPATIPLTVQNRVLAQHFFTIPALGSISLEPYLRVYNNQIDPNIVVDTFVGGNISFSYYVLV